MKRIGLTQRVDVVASYKERRDCLDQRWAVHMLSLSFCPVPLANDVTDVGTYVDALGLDGVVLTGGNDLSGLEGSTDIAPERDRFEGLLLDVCGDRQLPVLGVCRGLQFMNIQYGGSVTGVEGHVARRHSMSLDPVFFHGCPQSIVVNSYHNFAIDERGRSIQLKPIAWADDGTIEAVAHISLPQFGVMWHPEREESLAPHDILIIRGAFGGG